MAQLANEKQTLQGGAALPGAGSAAVLATASDGTLQAAARSGVATHITGLVQGVETASRVTAPGKSCIVHSITVDQPCRVRIYGTQAQQTADRTRKSNQSAAGSGCLLEVLLTAAQTLSLSPVPHLVEQDTVPTSSFYANVRCDNGTVLNVTLNGFALET